MLSDTDLAEYLDGATGGEARSRFEELAAQNEGTMIEIVAQLRIHRMLQLLADGANEEAALKDAILDAALGRGLRDASAGSGRRNQEAESEPNTIFAATCLVLVIILAICLWYFAPRP